MLKKILLGTLFVGLIVVLVAGAVIRTTDKAEQLAEARGLGGRGESIERLYSNYEALPKEWLEYEGTVVQDPKDDQDLMIRTSDGKEVAVGTGPGYMASQGFTLQIGESVRVQGYWEDNEFKAAQVTRLMDGQTIALRDAGGRPAWAGAGRNAQGSYGSQGREDAPGDGTGIGEAHVEEWLTIQGTVVNVDANALVVQTASGERVTVGNRAWWFSQEQGFSVQVGDQVTLVGFYEGDDLEVGQIDNASSGQTVLIRDENGRPLWVGKGRGGRGWGGA